jgi:hypothetical protein
VECVLELFSEAFEKQVAPLLITYGTSAIILHSVSFPLFPGTTLFIITDVICNQDICRALWGFVMFKNIPLFVSE